MLDLRERHGWEKADGPAIVSDLIVGEKTSQMWRERKKKKTQPNTDLGHQKGKARRSLMELGFGRESGGVLEDSDLDWSSRVVSSSKVALSRDHQEVHSAGTP